ncbi:hypothetical protein IQ13_1281 [Lacibacter cauensis]|uniref:Uncharacterized protein n=1 Tax=Lacibacter cauensis TaxID=510947 RepID=A0A562SPG7_9BACT|nr:hypothetical protein [Lacibacter cauensis]TWI83175.1 hypothetical protein IQ13_1281 [Lacibacter cauensis]
MKQVFLFIAFLLTSIYAVGQINADSMRLQYNQKTIRLGNRISMNGIVLEKTTVQNLMLLSPEATGYYKQYLKSRNVGNTLPLIGTAAVIGGILIAQKNRAPGNIIILSGNTINLVASLFRKKAANHLQDAVWTYNRDVLYPKR